MTESKIQDFYVVLRQRDEEIMAFFAIKQHAESYLEFMENTTKFNYYIDTYKMAVK